tara:strand:+ start:1906 stop:2886 length:981 start_codon:yes stop_codon:yes gene_type:complete
MVFTTITSTESDGTFFEIYNANRQKDLAHLKRTYTQAVLGCSDARCEEDAILPGELLVLNTAGNRIKVLEIPHSIEQILVVGHELTEGVGCGAVGLASTMAENETYVNDQGIPNSLAAVGDTCEGHTRDNAIAFAKEVYDKWAIESFPMIFNHGDGSLIALDDVNNYSPKMKDLVQKALVHNESYKTGYNPVSDRGDVREGQNPFAVAVTLGVDPTFSDLTGKGGKFNGSNTIFEVKPGASMLTELALGSLEYPWLHAMNKPEESFYNTDTTVFAVHDADALQTIAGQIQDNPALKAYVGDGGKGKVYAVVVNKDTFKFDQAYRWE